MFPITRATLQSFCCVCLQELKNPSNKHEPNHHIQEDNNLKKWLLASADYVVASSNPRLLCHSCYSKARTFYEFREKSYCSTEALKELSKEDIGMVALSNLQLFCRTCLKRLTASAEAKNVYESELQNWMYECTGVEILVESQQNKEKDFPRLMCSWCFKKLRNFKEFRRVARQSFDYLESVLGEEKDENQDKVLQQSELLLSERRVQEEIPSCPDIFVNQLPELKETLSDSDDNDYEGDAFGDLNDSFEYSKINSFQEDSKESTCESDDENIATLKRRINGNDPQKLSSQYNLRINKGVQQIKIEGDGIRDIDNENNDMSSESEEFDNLDQKDDNMCTSSGKKIREVYKCLKCSKQFRKRFIYEKHLQQHEGIQKPYACDHCPKAYASNFYLSRHMKDKHTNPSKQKNSKMEPESHICGICCKVFKRRDHLSDHVKAVHEGIRSFKCSFCDKTFAARKSWRVHEMIHTGERPYPCNYCDKSYRQISDLKIHTEKHTTSPELLCPICYRAKSSTEELQRHLEEHNKLKYQCFKCGKIFRKHSHLRDHDNSVHLKLRPFSCSYCTMSFALKKTLTSHERIHLEKRSNVCPICNVTFKQWSSVQNHVRQKHKGMSQSKKSKDEEDHIILPASDVIDLK